MAKWIGFVQGVGVNNVSVPIAVVTTCIPVYIDVARWFSG